MRLWAKGRQGAPRQQAARMDYGFSSPAVSLSVTLRLTTTATVVTMTVGKLLVGLLGPGTVPGTGQFPPRYGLHPTVSSFWQTREWGTDVQRGLVTS